ncbi:MULTISPECIES: TetR/AcrR family transcriptional regulator [unclassified Streptomyces]|uniref:TetR/AcrR family transcriptional regulator n=1 Tax=unclassified Streptomyces TaxID=2593676 RepID=UPI002DDC3005|nr:MULTISPECIES: TetR/AcrR family transcriptional regulator [unclassified Streptomyces]WSA95634.1 TetR/AcrR family transcriptional regulator [Streptomyces sp. NBC_01795]WSB80052.1 TetR/AcrR family transcriptional regulator [Streptomyces sp. NBC_01775]WSS11740.1 TetR/AcrR family transcriptional regulator [Streptomyces sp. NBC_01186]WSS40453.1 TetR/AcrR family transcriptional regulator [Streptomyces sp. NBC_01187]
MSEVSAVPPDELTPGARKILDAAATLFYERGITAVGVDLIAKEAGVTKKTLYDRFGGKDALIAAYLRERDQRWRAWLTEWVDGYDGGPRGRVLTTLDALAEWMLRRNPRGCGFVNAAAELPDPAHPGRQVITEQKRWLRGYLYELGAAAGVTDPGRAGRLADELTLLHEGVMVLRGIGVVDDPVGAARAMAEAALDRATAT